MTNNKIDIIETEKETFEKILNELTKEELIEVFMGLKEELTQEYEHFYFWFNNIPFERIRRITGYLGSIDRWNNGKRAELEDRVKHD